MVLVMVFVSYPRTEAIGGSRWGSIRNPQNGNRAGKSSAENGQASGLASPRITQHAMLNLSLAELLLFA